MLLGYNSPPPPFSVPQTPAVVPQKPIQEPARVVLAQAPHPVIPSSSEGAGYDVLVLPLISVVITFAVAVLLAYKLNLFIEIYPEPSARLPILSLSDPLIVAVDHDIDTLPFHLPSSTNTKSPVPEGCAGLRNLMGTVALW